MKVLISDIMNENTNYWYKAKEIYDVKADTAISYRVAKGEHEDKMIYLLPQEDSHFKIFVRKLSGEMNCENKVVS